MHFSKANEENFKLSFLDVLINKQSGKVCTPLYKKNAFSGLYLNFKSFVSHVYKKGLILCLVFRIYNICSDWNRIQEEIQKLKCLLPRNNLLIFVLCFS